MTKKEKAADNRLYKTYGIRLVDYENMLKQGGGGCWICGTKPKPNRRLHVDHSHAFHKVKISAVKDPVLSVETPWYGMAMGWPLKKDEVIFSPSYYKTSKEAKQAIRTVIKKMSIRGLLDWKCNAGLQKWRDNPNTMASAVKYLINFKEKLDGTDG